MKTPRLTAEKVFRAVRFLEKRRDHARKTKNLTWLEEFENAVNVITELSAVARK